jgi:rod shape-determining protein MreC
MVDRPAMAGLDIRQRTGWLFVAVIVGHIILISAQVNTERGVPVLEAVTFGVFAEVQRGATSAVSSVQDGWENYFALQQIRQENERLRQEVGQLRIGLQQERAAAQQSRTLQELLDLQGGLTLRTAAAAVIGSGPDASFRTITIDKGTQDGLRPDMAVIAPAGAVGRIIMTSARASKVQLLIDRGAGAGVMVERSRVLGVVSGAGDTDELGFRAGLIDLDYIPSTADVQVGDQVVTSGIDGIYPKGFAVGKIESVAREAVEWRITVRPSVDFATLEAVLVVLDPPAAATDLDGQSTLRGPLDGVEERQNTAGRLPPPGAVEPARGAAPREPRGPGASRGTTGSGSPTATSSGDRR